MVICQKGVHDELQMGAISGLSDLQAEEVPSTHINAFADFSKEHRQLALDALLRSDDRCRAILNALAENRRPRSGNMPKSSHCGNMNPSRCVCSRNKF